VSSVPPTQSKHIESGRRHHRERPLEKLTNVELHALVELSKASVLLSERFSDPLDSLGDLATRELLDREMADV
jgi:hypothetical protein